MVNDDWINWECCDISELNLDMKSLDYEVGRSLEILILD